MCLKIRCDGESEKILQIFWETKQGLSYNSVVSETAEWTE